MNGELTTTYIVVDENGKRYTTVVLKSAPPEVHQYAQAKLLHRRLDNK